MATKNKRGVFTVYTLERIAVCSKECAHNAFEDFDDTALTARRVGAGIASVIQCYGCGLYFDEIESL